jgi:hypothetical protein
VRFDITAAEHGIISNPREEIDVQLGIQERPGISRGKSVQVSDDVAQAHGNFGLQSEFSINWSDNHQNEKHTHLILKMADD